MSEITPLLPRTAGDAPALPPSHDLSVFPEALRGRRILLCTESFGPVNGVSRTTLMLVNHLRSHGVHVAVVAPHNHTQQNTFVPAAGANDTTGQVEVRIHGYPLPFNPELSVVYPVRVSTLVSRTFGADYSPDLIYLASPASLGFQVMLQVRQQPREKQVPVICNFQTDLSGYCSILFPAPLSSLAVYTFATVQSYLFRHSSVKTVFYPSRFVQRYLESNHVQPQKLEVLRRGVNVDLFRPEQRSDQLRRQIAPNGEIILVCVSRVAGEKGFEFLARAAKELDARGLAFKLYIVGGNRNAEVERSIHELFDPLREQGKVIFAGFKVGDELAEAYASGDIFLHCSVTETFGLVVLESMASGVPVVARDEGGPSDIIVHGDSGFLVPPEQLDAFVAKVLLLAGDAELRRHMGAESRRLACEATWDKINNKVAWRMLDTIEEREREAARAEREKESALAVARSGTTQALPVYQWLQVNDSLRDLVTSRVVDARLLGGFGVISSFWVLTGLYLAFTELALWLRRRVPRVVECVRGTAARVA